MSDKHTQEPWSVKYDNAIYGNDGYYVGGAEYGCNEHIDCDENRLSINRGSEVAHENANRIVACVNSCAGIPTYQLFAEDDKPLNLGEQIDALRKQRDELLSEGRQFVTIQESEDGVWAHFRVNNGYSYSINLSVDDMSRKFAVEYIHAMKGKKGESA